MRARSGLALVLAVGAGSWLFAAAGHGVSTPHDEPTRAVAGLGPPPVATTDTAIFAGGCFWCMEHPFDELDGVLSTTSGYTGGHTANPTYEEVSSGTTGHREAEQVVFDRARVRYTDLLEVFWANIDPTDDGGQFCDRGPQYRAAIFYRNEEQERLARESRQAIQQSGIIHKPIVTDILPASVFFPAEAYHQDYYRSHPVLYRFYRLRCGRDRMLRSLWGKRDRIAWNHTPPHTAGPE